MLWHSHRDQPVSRIADREKRLRLLVEANVAVGSEASLDDVLQKTVEVAARLVVARYAALGVLDRTGSHLARLITTGIDDTTRARIGDLPSDHGVLRILLREARPVRVADVTKEPHFFGFPPGHPPMRTFLGVPILVRGVVYGDLYLAEKEDGEFTEADEEIVTLLAAQTGITIEKVQIHEGPSTGFISSRRSTSSHTTSSRSGRTCPASSSSSPVACAS
jgi:GAF domain-containing protein